MNLLCCTALMYCKLASANRAAIAERVFVRQLDLDHVGENFRVPMWVSTKAHALGNDVVVDHTQAPEAHVSGIEAVAEGERVAALQPAEPRCALAPRKAASPTSAWWLVRERAVVVMLQPSALRRLRKNPVKLYGISTRISASDLSVNVARSAIEPRRVEAARRAEHPACRVQ